MRISASTTTSSVFRTRFQSIFPTYSLVIRCPNPGAEQILQTPRKICASQRIFGSFAQSKYRLAVVWYIFLLQQNNCPARLQPTLSNCCFGSPTTQDIEDPEDSNIILCNASETSSMHRSTHVDVVERTYILYLTRPPPLLLLLLELLLYGCSFRFLLMLS